jgi:hypothetical protein
LNDSWEKAQDCFDFENKAGVDPRFKDVRLLHGGYSKQLYRVSIYGIWRRKQEKKRILLSEGGYVIYGNHVCQGCGRRYGRQRWGRPKGSVISGFCAYV